VEQAQPGVDQIQPRPSLTNKQEQWHPTPKAAVFKINVKVVQGLIAIAVFLVGGIGWGTRLEYRTETNRDDAVKITSQLESIRNDRLRDNDRITRAESQLTFILQGIEEIKGLLKERDHRSAP
jgi:hypothetical protein